MIRKQLCRGVLSSVLFIPLIGCLAAEDAETTLEGVAVDAAPSSSAPIRPSDPIQTPLLPVSDSVPDLKNTIDADEMASEPTPSDDALQKAIITRSQRNPEPTFDKLSVDELCNRVAVKLRSVQKADCNGHTMKDSGAVSVLGKPLLTREYPPVGGRESQGRVLLIGGIHGDEYSSVSIVFHWMRTLDKYHSGMFHWMVVPLLNPDGLLRDDPQRMNDRGVDLNRNFPTPNWQASTDEYWNIKTKRNPRRYPGPGPLSEPESQWLVELIREFKPDVIVSVHAPYGILDFDGPRTAPKRLGHLHLNVLGTYPGSLGNYAGVQNKIPVVTIELPYAGIMPTSSEVSRIWSDLIVWLKSHVKEESSTPNVVVRDKKTQMEPS